MVMMVVIESDSFRIFIPRFIPGGVVGLVVVVLFLL